MKRELIISVLYIQFEKLIYNHFLEITETQ